MLNKITLIGNLGRDIEVRTLENGTKVGTFSLATTESYKDKSDQWQKLTEWHNIVIWRPSDSICKLTKGSLVYIEGKIKSRKYADKDGVERTLCEIVSEKVVKLDKVSNDGQNGSKAVPYDEMYKDPVVDDGPKSPGLSFDEDLPF